jgi:hypothetical protein
MLRELFGSKSEDEQTADLAGLSNIKADLNAIGDLTNHVM